MYFFEGVKVKPKAPWSKYYKEGAMDIKETNESLYSYVEKKVSQFAKCYCIDYYGNQIRYNEFLKMIDNCAKSFYNSGIRKGDIVTICLPNTLEAIVSFLATNKIGAIANFIHPSCSENELRDSLEETNCKVLVVVDKNFIKIKNIIEEIDVSKVVLVNVGTYMSWTNKIRHSFKEKNKIKFSKDGICCWWNNFISMFEKSKINNYTYEGNKDNPALILHSGGTTGSPKGVVLSNNNVISYIEMSMVEEEYLVSGDVILTVMPISHALGLIHSVIYSLCKGMKVVLRAKFEVKEYCKMIKKYKPQVLVGVPTMYEYMLKEWNDTDFKLDFLKNCLVSGDLLKPELRAKVNSFFKKHGSDVRIIQGYGLTEASGGAIHEINIEKPNTIGIPFPGVYVGIFSKEDEELPYGEEGEICVCGPTVMIGYYKKEEETKSALHVHKDGNIWLHTGDVGVMDEDGFVTYISRLKRMIVSSGYNVYPNRIEKLLELHPEVMKCVVVGVEHKYKVEDPKAFITLKNKAYAKRELLIKELKEICAKNLPKYSWPYKYEFIEEFPITRVGKVDFKKLQKYKEENDIK